MNNTVSIKTCKTCKIKKPREAFYNHPTAQDGLQTRCKDCVKFSYSSPEAKAKRREKYNSDPIFRAKCIESAKKNMKTDKSRIRQRAYNKIRYQKQNDYYKKLKKDRVEQIKNNGGNFSATDRKRLFAVYGKICLKCGSDKDITVDHIVPVKLGGTRDISNRQPLCRSCNCSKFLEVTDYRPFPLP